MHATQERSHRSRLPQDTRREQLMDATIDVIAEHGLSNLTLGKVAERAGLTAAMVNFHFETKQDLLDATLARLAAEMTENLDRAVERGAGSPAATLVALAESAFDPVVFSNEKVAALEAFWGAGVSSPDYFSVCSATARDFEDRICAEFDRLAETAGSAIDTRVASLGLVGLVDILWWRIMSQQSGAAEAKRNCRRYLANMFPSQIEELPGVR